MKSKILLVLGVCAMASNAGAWSYSFGTLNGKIQDRFDNNTSNWEEPSQQQDPTYWKRYFWKSFHDGDYVNYAAEHARLGAWNSWNRRGHGVFFKSKRRVGGNEFRTRAGDYVFRFQLWRFNIVNNILTDFDDRRNSRNSDYNNTYHTWAALWLWTDKQAGSRDTVEVDVLENYHWINSNKRIDPDTGVHSQFNVYVGDHGSVSNRVNFKRRYTYKSNQWRSVGVKLTGGVNPDFYVQGLRDAKNVKGGWFKFDWRGKDNNRTWNQPLHVVLQNRPVNHRGGSWGPATLEVASLSTPRF